MGMVERSATSNKLNIALVILQKMIITVEKNDEHQLEVEELKCQ